MLISAITTHVWTYWVLYLNPTLLFLCIYSFFGIPLHPLQSLLFFMVKSQPPCLILKPEFSDTSNLSPQTNTIRMVQIPFYPINYTIYSK